ncbi:putative chitinase [Pseudoduganella lurida]|uniref:Putative chitinase n=1 Tax=Pseudoduganella lurida TaxID=1036180 RepID=A0A562RLI0_9BURK|nr:glycoside hydrolase family 19 protein [Pseudoduganella lurida]TWI69879.1 putative chitinase [Pseudoduganella lurida]
MLNGATLKRVFPDCSDADDWASALDDALARFHITTRDRVCAFLAQTSHESAHFNRLEESLFYRSPARLMAVWPKRFMTEAAAQPFVQQPEALGNFIYAGRMGNGDAASGDGFRFRGRGLIQLTGRSNYRQAGEALGLDLVKAPDRLVSKDVAALSAAWFWESRGLNALADHDEGDDDMEDFVQITRRINGGTVGLKERFEAFQKLRSNLD